jgi:hypothetical protein
MRPLAPADDDTDVPQTWTFYADSAIVVFLSVTVMGLVVLTAIGVYYQIKCPKYK